MIYLTIVMNNVLSYFYRKWLGGGYLDFNLKLMKGSKGFMLVIIHKL
jgi:hypothetical protein